MSAVPRSALHSGKGNQIGENNEQENVEKQTQAQTAHNTKDHVPASRRGPQVTHTKQTDSKRSSQSCWDILSGSGRVAKTVCDASYVGPYAGRTESTPDTKK